MSEKPAPKTGRADNPANVIPKKPPAPSGIMGAKLREQARQKIRDEGAKRRDFATGKKRFTDGK